MTGKSGQSEKRSLLCLFLQGDTAALERRFEAAGWHVVYAANVNEAELLLRRHQPSVGLAVLEDAYQPTDIGALERLVRSGLCMEWVAAVPADLMRDATVRDLIVRHFHDYHTMPIDFRRLADSVGHAHGMAGIRQASFDIEPLQVNGHQMIGVGPAMSQVFRQIDKIAGVDASVMISGASGTGKELAALSIHKHSHRAEGPFVAVNCGAIPVTLIQSELFGHEKGAFTGAHKRQIGRIEAADGGTIFLDEIGDLSLELQVNLLRFLQEKTIERVGGTESIPVDVRVITATHVDLQRSVQTGEFREDLYYRLHVLSLELPPLCERREDIEPLARYYLQVFSSESSRRIDGFSSGALLSMNAHDWPGNVRELKNRIQRAVVMCEQRLIDPQDLGLEAASETDMDAVVSLAEVRREADRGAVQQALLCSGNNITKAARQLGISRVSFYRMMERLKLSS